MLGRTKREHVLALGLFAAVTVLFFFPLLQGDTFADIAGREQQLYPWAGAVTTVGESPTLHYDQDDTVYPWQVFMNRELRAGHFPLWNPYSFGGTPFFANGQSGVLYPPRLALSYTVAAHRVHDLLLVTHLFLAGMMMFLLLSSLGLSFPAALLGGLAWMLNSFGLAWQALEHYVVIEAGLPLGVLLAHATVKRRSWAAALWLGVVLGLVFVGGNALFVELAVVTVLGYGVALAVAALRSDRRLLAGAGLRLGVAAALGLGLAAVSVLPTFALAGQSARVSLTYHELSSFALSWSDLKYILWWPKDPFKTDPYHRDLFAGTVVPLLALVGVVRRTFAARFAAVVALLTLLFMLHTPVTYVVDVLLPGFGNFKPLARAAFLFQFAMAILAAFGVQTLLERMSASRRIRFGSTARATAALVGIVAVSIVAQEWVWKQDVMLHQPAGEQYLYPPTPMIGALQSEPVSRFFPTYPTFRGSTAMIYDLPSAGGYESLLPARTQSFWRVLGDRLAPDSLAAHPLVYAYHPAFDLAKVQPGLLARASVSHVVAAPPDVVAAPVPGRLRLEHAGSDGRIFKVAGALPVAYVVGACEVADSRLAALDRFISDDFHPSGRVILERADLRRVGLTCAGSQSGRVGSGVVASRSLNSLVLLAEADRPGWLVVAESWDEGWTATVDGRPAHVFPADSALRAVRLTPGEHTVRFSYQPPSFVVGAIISSVSLGLALGGIALTLWRRWRRPSSAIDRTRSRRGAGPAAG
jgi:membrane protein YfhO